MVSASKNLNLDFAYCFILLFEIENTLSILIVMIIGSGIVVALLLDFG